MAVNPQGDWLTVASSQLGQLLVWEWQSETYIMKQQGHFHDMNCVAYSPDGQFLATGGADAKVCSFYECEIMKELRKKYVLIERERTR